MFFIRGNFIAGNGQYVRRNFLDKRSKACQISLIGGNGILGRALRQRKVRQKVVNRFNVRHV